MERDEVTLEDVDGMTVREATGLAGMRDAEGALGCRCGCHHRRFGQPLGDLHQQGVDCPCQYPPEGNGRRLREWLDDGTPATPGKRWGQRPARMSGAKVVRLANEHLDRFVRRGTCAHPVADPDAVSCSRCGERLSPFELPDERT